MKISIRPGDSGYPNHATLRATGRRASVKLNGELQTYCVTADSEAGVVVRYVQPFRYDQERQRLVDEVVHGKVEIEFAEANYDGPVPLDTWSPLPVPNRLFGSYLINEGDAT